MLVDSLGSLDGLEVGCNEGTALLIYDGIVLGTTLGDSEETKIGTYGGTQLGSL